VVEMPKIDSQKCNGCGLCVTVCSCKALVLVGNTVTIIETQECRWCAECEAVCPSGAITCPFEIVLENSQE
jgi:MinD superfamily P-loop ATPase